VVAGLTRHLISAKIFFEFLDKAPVFANVAFCLIWHKPRRKLNICGKRIEGTALMITPSLFRSQIYHMCRVACFPLGL